MNSDTTKLQPFADWLPFAYVLCISGVDFWADMQRRGPGYSHTSFIAFIPMAFFFTGLVLMRYRKRIETLEKRIEEIESTTSTKA
jgi:hypothetical protein